MAIQNDVGALDLVGIVTEIYRAVRYRLCVTGHQVLLVRANLTRA
jgi:hypothetical protein